MNMEQYADAPDGPWTWVADETDDPWDGKSYLERCSLVTVATFPTWGGMLLPKFILSAECIGGSPEKVAAAKLLADAPMLAKKVVELSFAVPSASGEDNKPLLDSVSKLKEFLGAHNAPIELKEYVATLRDMERLAREHAALTERLRAAEEIGDLFQQSTSKTNYLQMTDAKRRWAAYRQQPPEGVKDA